MSHSPKRDGPRWERSTATSYTKESKSSRFSIHFGLFPLTLMEFYTGGQECGNETPVETPPGILFLRHKQEPSPKKKKQQQQDLKKQHEGFFHNFSIPLFTISRICVSRFFPQKMALFLFGFPNFQNPPHHEHQQHPLAHRGDTLDPLASALLSAFSGGEVEEVALQFLEPKWGVLVFNPLFLGWREGLLWVEDVFFSNARAACFFFWGG